MYIFRELPFEFRWPVLELLRSDIKKVGLGSLFKKLHLDELRHIAEDRANWNAMLKH